MRISIDIRLEGDSNRAGRRDQLFVSTETPGQSMQLKARLVLLALLTWTGAAVADDPAWLSFPAGLNYNLVRESDGSATARVPVAYADAASGAEKTLKVRVTDVLYKEGRSDTLAGALDVKFNAPTLAAGPSIVVTVKKESAATVLPGAYVVSLLVAEDLAQTKPKPQVVTLTLQRPVPQLAPTSAKVVVGQIVDIFGAATTTNGTLGLQEQSGKAEAGQLFYVDSHEPPATGLPDSARLSFDGAASAVPPTKTVDIVVGAKGAFPLGTTSGRISVQSPELGAPVPVTFEVRARRELWLIAVCAALGAVAGWIIRTWLASKQALLNAETGAYEAIAAMMREIGKREDKGYRQALAEAYETLNQAILGKDAAKILAATKKAIDDVTTLRTALEQRVAPVRTKTVGLHDLLTVDWKFGDAGDQILASMRDELRSTEELLAKDNVTDAETGIADLMTVKLPALVGKIGQFGTDLARYLAALADQPPPYSADVAQELKSLATTATTTFKWPYAPPEAPTVDDARLVFKNADGLIRQSATFAGAAPDLAQSFMDSVDAKLLPYFPNASEKTVVIAAASVASASAMAQDITMPAQAVLRVRDRASTLRQEWSTFLTALAPNAPPAEINQALLTAQWSAAVDIALKAFPKPVTPATKALEDKALAAKPDAEIMDLSDAPFTLPALDVPRQTGTPLAFDPSPVLHSVISQGQAVAAQSKRLAAIQSFGFGLLFVIGSYVLYSDTWVGTAKEMLTLFVLAFGVDLTSDSVLGAFKKLKLPEA